MIPELFKDEEERSLAFLFGLDSVRFKAWHTEIKNRVSEAPKTRKGVLEAARERNDKEDWGTDKKLIQPSSRPRRQDMIKSCRRDTNS